MPEKPLYAKHLVEKDKKPSKDKKFDEIGEGSLEELRQQALEVLGKKYQEIIKKAEEEKKTDIDKALELLEQAKKMLDKYEKIKISEDILIDDLEEIIGVDARKEGESTEVISGTNPEGKEIKFELKEQLKYWEKFYKDNGIDWVDLPESISVSEEQAKEMKRLIEKHGFDKMIIIPEGLADNGDKYEDLHQKMTVGLGYMKSEEWSLFKEDGGIKGLKNNSNKLRIILTKEVKELDEYKLFNETINKRLEKEEASEVDITGIMEENKLEGLDLATYLILQGEYYKRTGQHLDEKLWTWITSMRRPSSGRVPDVYWDPAYSQLDFGSHTTVFRGGSLGCRLAGSFSARGGQGK